MTQQQSEKCPVCDRDYQEKSDGFCQNCRWPINPTIELKRNKQDSWIKKIWKMLTKPYLVKDYTKDIKYFFNEEIKWAKLIWDEKNELIEREEASKNKEELIKKIQELTEKNNLIEHRINVQEHRINVLEQNRGGYFQNIAPSETGIPSDRESTQTPQSSEVTKQLPNDNQSYIQQFQWIEKYNRDPNLFSECATRVTQTEDSIKNRRNGFDQSVVLVKSPQGKLWILTNPELEKSGEYLVPKSNDKLDEYSLQMMKPMFEFSGCAPESASNFKVIKPALVETVSQDNWQLRSDGQGILLFEQ